MKKFHEYLSARGNVRGTAKTAVVADELEVSPGKGHMQSPPKEKLGPSGGKHQPYTPDGKKVVSAKGKGFGDLGSEKPYDVTHKTAPAKLPTAEFAYHELLPKVRDAIKACPSITENLVRELQRSNLLGILVGEMLSNNETYKHIAECMASKQHGYGVCRKLAKAMREGVAAPFHQAMDHGDEMDPNGGMDPNLGLTGDEGMEERPTMKFGAPGDPGAPGAPGDDLGGDEFGDDEFGDDLGGDEFGDDEFGDDLGGDDEFGDEDPFAPKPEDDLAGGDELGAPDPNAVGPDGQPLPPNPNRPPVPPRPMGPPAMENMRRAMKTVFESYRPLSEPVATPKRSKRKGRK